MFVRGHTEYGVRCIEQRRNALQVRVVRRADACNTPCVDLTLGCDYHCVYCHFQLAARHLHARRDSAYDGSVVPLSVLALSKSQELPSEVYFCYACDPCSPSVRDGFHKLLAAFARSGTRIQIITKGLVAPTIFPLLFDYRDQMNIQVGISSLCEERNKVLEPGAPSAQERLMNLQQLVKLRPATIAARIDPLFPILDDAPEDLERLIHEVAATGVNNVVGSYILITRHIRKILSRIPTLRESMRLLTDEISTVAGRGTQSVSRERRERTYNQLHRMCADRGMVFHICGCKDFTLAGSSNYSSICHPRDKNNFLGPRERMTCTD